MLKEKNHRTFPSENSFFPKNHKGISGVIVVVILIALVMVVSVIVWTVINNLVTDKLGKAESCFGIFGEVTINSRYTCYKSSFGEFQFSINIGDIDVDEIIIAISGNGTTKSYELSYINATDYTIKPFGSDDYTDNVTLPEKNAGLTYVTNSFSTKPDLIEIMPVINKNKCEVSDSLSEIDYCSLLS